MIETPDRSIFQLPKPFEKKKKNSKAGRGIHTVKGRVVYNRKPHLFKLSDAKRILEKILLFTRNSPTASEYQEFKAEWVELMVMSMQLLASYRGKSFDSSILRDFFQFLFVASDPVSELTDFLKEITDGSKKQAD